MIIDPTHYHDEGYEACYEGVDKEHNPYPEDSESAKAWLEGWEEADEEDV